MANVLVPEYVIDSVVREHSEAEQILGAALHYPRYADDPANFPGVTGDSGVCVGEHTLVTLAQEAAKRIGDLEAQVAKMHITTDELVEYIIAKEGVD